MNLTIITGASRGMGLAMAQQLIKPHAHVLCISRNTNAALEAKALQAGAVLTQWACDLSNATPVAQRLITWLEGQATSEVFPQLTGVTLINNAGVIPAVVPLAQGDAADLANALRVGLEAPLLLSGAFLKATAAWHMPRKLLNISSGLGRRAMASSAAYCAAKAGMDHFSRCAFIEQAALGNGARICSLAPGVIDTDMQVQLRSANPAQFADVANFANLHSAGLLSSPDDAASKILAYLASTAFGSKEIADIREL